MNNTPIAAWGALKKYYNDHKNNELEGVNFNEKSQEKFINAFRDLYDKIMKDYMADGVEELDRHKQGAILLVSTMKSEVFLTNKLPGDKISIACEKIGLMLALSYMKDMLNLILTDVKEKNIKQFILPEAFSCDNKYIDILSRDLVLQKHKDDCVYTLFLAHVLFLIEYNTLSIVNKPAIEKIKKYTLGNKQKEQN